MMYSVHTDYAHANVFRVTTVVDKTYLGNASDSVCILDFVTKPVALCDLDKKCIISIKLSK